MKRRFGLNIPLTLVVIFWGFNFVAMKLLYDQMEPAALALLRFLGVWALLVVYCAIRRESLKLPREDAVRILMCGFTAMGLYMVPFLEGLKRTAPANCAIILATAPLFTIIFSWITRQEKSSLPALIGSGISFVGVAIVISGGAHHAGEDSLFGDLLVLSSALVWGWATILMRPLLQKYSSVQLFTMSLPGALPVLLPYGLASIFSHPIHGFTPVGWLLFGHITVLSGVVAFVCFYAGFKQTSAATTTMYQFFIPPTAAIFGWLVMKTPLSMVQLVGILVVICGVWIVSTVRNRPLKPAG